MDDKIILALGTMLAVCIAPCGWAQAPAQTPMKADETVKNPVGYEFARPMANPAACAAAYPGLYATALASAAKFCVKWYKCPEGAPGYAPTKNQAQACSCALGFQGQLTAVCDLTWNGLCGCQSPSESQGLASLNVALTDLEISQVRRFYPLVSQSLTSLLQGRSPSERQAALAILAKGFQSYQDGGAFTVKSISAGSQQGLDVFLVPALADAAHIRNAVARVRVSRDGTARMEEGRGLPGGIRRSLLTALAVALNPLGTGLE